MTRPVRLLLVEDNAGDADLTRETLQLDELVLEISVITDGAAALSYLRREAELDAANLPSLIVLDLNLPGMSGHEVLAELRTHEALQAIPVVVLTSSDARQDIRKSYALGANCHVTKPVGLRAFQATVRSVAEFWLRTARVP